MAPPMPSCLTVASSVDFFNSWASASATTWHTTTCCLVYLHHDGVNDAFNLFLLGLELILFGQLIFVEPIQGVLHCGFNLFLVSTLELVLQLVVRKCVPHLEAIVLQAVLRLDLLLVLLILGPVLLCLLHHAVDLRLRKPAFFICNGNLIRLATGLVLSRYIEDAIRVDIESDLNLRDTTRGWRNTIEMEFSQQVVILRHRTLAFKDLDEYTWLIVCVGRECLAFFCWDSCIPLNELRHDTSCGFEAHRQRSHIQQQQVLHRGGAFTSQNSGLHR